MLPLNAQRYSELPGEETWGDTLRTYAAKRSKLPWGDGETVGEPANRVSHFTVKRRHREFDPIQGRYRDTDREADAQLTEKAAVDETLLRARQRQLKYDAQLFDILTNEGHADLEQVTGNAGRPPVDNPALQTSRAQRSTRSHRIADRIAQ